MDNTNRRPTETAPTSYIVSYAEKLCARLRRDELGYMVQAGVLDDLLSAVDLLGNAMAHAPSEALTLAHNSAMLALDMYCDDIEADLRADSGADASFAFDVDAHKAGL